MADAALERLQSATDALFPGGTFAYDKEKLITWLAEFVNVQKLKDSLDTAQTDKASDSGDKVIQALEQWREPSAPDGGRRRTRSTKGPKSRRRRTRSTRRR